jgi:methyl-accepting chemotaxis protein
MSTNVPTINVQSSLARLTSLSQVLNDTSNQLSANIAEIEQALNQLNWGVSAWVHDDPVKMEESSATGPDGKPRTVHTLEELGYASHEGKWGFVIASGTEESWPDDVSIRFLREAPLETKLLAMERISKLLDLVAEGLNKISQEATQKAAEAKEIASALRRD